MEVVTPSHLVHEIKPGMMKPTQELRKKAYPYLLTLRGEGLLGTSEIFNTLAPGEVSALQDGEVSAAFFFNDRSNPSVLKLRNKGADAEAETLRAWRQAGLDVPAVLGNNEVPGTNGEVRFVLMEAVVDPSRNLSANGHHYTSRHPDARKGIITSLGKQLALMHGVVVDKPFGGFADMWGAHRADPNYKSFLKGLIYNQTKYEDDNGTKRNILAENGVSEKEVEEINAVIDSMNFPDKGTYVHGDFGLHNALVQVMLDGSTRTRIIDPNPRITDPYWDIAHQKLRAELHPGDDYFQILMEAYQSVKPGEFDPRRLDVHEFVVNLQSLGFFSRGAQKSPEKMKQFETRKALVKTLATRILK